MKGADEIALTGGGITGRCTGGVTVIGPMLPARCVG